MSIKENIEETMSLCLDFKKLCRLEGQRVIPVAVQNQLTRELILVAYTNEEALKETIRLRRLVLWSTTRQKLWYKGSEESGNRFFVEEIRVNCEQNSLLYLVRPERGGICHTRDAEGRHRNCYYRRLNLETGALEFREGKK
ncbi:MAG: hypothetical protein FWH26_03760 [Oscillospiraceae bacterium]|nr:hypothetical protein [Oscillospiraceae bacterium]